MQKCVNEYKCTDGMDIECSSNLISHLVQSFDIIGPNSDSDEITRIGADFLIRIHIFRNRAVSG